MNVSCYYSVIITVFTGIIITVTIAVEKSDLTYLCLDFSWKSKSEPEADALAPGSRGIRKKTMEGISHIFIALKSLKESFPPHCFYDGHNYPVI